MSATIIPFPQRERTVEPQDAADALMAEMVRRIERLRAEERREDLEAACAAHYRAQAAEQSKQD